MTWGDRAIRMGGPVLGHPGHPGGGSDSDLRFHGQSVDRAWFAIVMTIPDPFQTSSGGGLPAMVAHSRLRCKRHLLPAGSMSTLFDSSPPRGRTHGGCRFRGIRGTLPASAGPNRTTDQ